MIPLCTISLSFAVLFGTYVQSHAQTSEWELWLKSSRPDLRLRAVDALTESANVRGILESVDHHDPFVRAASINALARLGSTAINPLIEHVRSDDAVMRAKAIHVLLNVLGRHQMGGLTLLPDIEAGVLQELASQRCFEGACIRSWVRPVYGLARNWRIEGRVWISFHIAGTGQPETISAKGHPLLVSAVESAIKQWRFSEHSARNPIRHSMLFEFYLVPPADYSNNDAVEMVFPNHVVTYGHPFAGSIDYGDVLRK